MGFWISFWEIFFFASLAAFAVLAVVVSIGGFFNIRSLFKSLSERTEKENRQNDEEDSTEDHQRNPIVLRLEKAIQIDPNDRLDHRPPHSASRCARCISK